MLHLAPVPDLDEPLLTSEALAKLAGIRHALRLVDPFGGGPASDPIKDDEIAASWAAASKASNRRFDETALRTAGAAAAGIDALLAVRAAGHEPNEAASKELAEEIRGPGRRRPADAAGLGRTCVLGCRRIGAPFAPASFVKPGIGIAEQMGGEDQ